MKWKYKSEMNQERGGKVGKLALDPVQCWSHRPTPFPHAGSWTREPTLPEKTAGTRIRSPPLLSFKILYGGRGSGDVTNTVPADTSTRELTNVSRQVVIRETEDKSSRSAPVYPAYQSRPNSLLKTQLNTVYAYAAGISPLAPEAQRSTIYTPSF